MKRIKKMLSIMLTMAMTLAMTVTAFATAPDSNTTAGTGEFSIKIQDATEGYTYEAYQIFAGDLAIENGVKTLSNIKWGANVDEAKVAAKYPGKSAEQVAKALAGKEKDFTLTAEDFAATIADCLTGTAQKTASSPVNGEYVLSPLTAGYYLVQNSTVSTNGAYTRYILEVVGDVTPAPKRDIPTPDKKIISENGDKVDVNEASIGDEVKYEIVGTMPSNIGDYKEYYYEFTDTLSKGLSINGTSGIEVYVGTKNSDGTIPEEKLVEVTNKFYKNTEKDNETKDTIITVSIQDVKALGNMENIEINDTTVIVVRYTAVLNEDAVIAGAGNPNDVKLTYSNDPNHSGTGTTNPPDDNPPKPTKPDATGESPKKEVITYTTELTILKTNEEDAFLPGVEFELTGTGVNVVLVTTEEFIEAEDGEYWLLNDGTYTKKAPVEDQFDEDGNKTVSGNGDLYDKEGKKYKKETKVTAKGEGKTDVKVVGTVQADGTVTFKGLGAGEYTITETKTLAGYNTIDPIKFTLTFDKDAKPMFKSNNDKVTVGQDNMLDTEIENKKGSLLPSTGGIGTTIFYIVGAVLVIGAAILLVTKKRMSKEA